MVLDVNWIEIYLNLDCMHEMYEKQDIHGPFTKIASHISFYFLL